MIKSWQLSSLEHIEPINDQGHSGPNGCKRLQLPQNFVDGGSIPVHYFRF